MDGIILPPGVTYGVDDIQAATTPDSPAAWLRRLERELMARQRTILHYDAYYEGEHPMAFASEKFRQSFGGLFSNFADNWCGLVVDAVEERLNVDGFRQRGQEKPLDDAWTTWQRNQLDAEFQVGVTEALVCSEAYLLVWPDDDEPGQAQITVEHPSQVIVAHDPGRRRKRLAALKLWVEDDGTARAVVYLPDGVYKYRTPAKYRAPSGSSTTGGGSRWVEWEKPSERWPSENPLKVVPVIPLTNRRRMVRAPRSEIADVIGPQDAVNKLIADLLVGSEFGAFRQRWATGIDIPKDPATNQPIEPFKAAIDRLWIANGTRDQRGDAIGPEPKFGEFGQTDLTGVVKAIELVVQHIASQTRTPPHYFYLSGQFPSGESIKSAETGLVSKAKRKMRHFGEAAEEAISLALQIESNAPADVAMETIWGDPESRTEGEHVDAVLKRKALGVPWRQLMEDLGYSPTVIDRMELWRTEEAALGLNTDALVDQLGRTPRGGEDAGAGG